MRHVVNEPGASSFLQTVVEALAALVCSQAIVASYTLGLHNPAFIVLALVAIERGRFTGRDWPEQYRRPESLSLWRLRRQANCTCHLCPFSIQCQLPVFQCFALETATGANTGLFERGSAAWTQYRAWQYRARAPPPLPQLFTKDTWDFQI